MKLRPTLDGYSNTSIERDYQQLAQQAIDALTLEAKTPYHEIEEAASQFAAPLAEALEARLDEEITLSHEPAQTLRELQAPYEYASLVQRYIGDPQRAREHHKRFLSQGIDVFASFEGRWRGVWFYNNREVAAFDHHWQPTQRSNINDSVELQPVVMGRLAKERLHQPAKPIGSDSDEPTPAVDAVSHQNGWIIGGVGLAQERQSTARPHVGYLPSVDLLIWVAREGSTTVSNRFSCFFERRYPDQSYRILGAQFLWQGAQLHFESFMGGVYQAPALVK